MLVAVVVLGLLSASAVHTQTGEHASVSFVRGASVYVVPGDGGRASRVLRNSSTTDSDIYYYDPAWSQDGLLAVAAYFEPTEGNAYSGGRRRP